MVDLLRCEIAAMFEDYFNWTMNQLQDAAYAQAQWYESMPARVGEGTSRVT